MFAALSFRRLFLCNMNDLWVSATKGVLSLLILTLLAALAGGVLATCWQLRYMFVYPLERVFQQIIVSTLMLLALVEVLKTTLTYFSEGRVKVTFIVDTILVVMLTEVISLWFKEGHLKQWGILGGILAILAIMRVIAVRFSPTKIESLAGAE